MAISLSLSLSVCLSPEIASEVGLQQMCEMSVIHTVNLGEEGGEGRLRGEDNGDLAIVQ